MKLLNIMTAILSTINTFGSHKFTIHDITKSIRQDIADEEYEIAFFGTLINHDTVKRHFEELRDNDLLSNYSMDHNASGYREFWLTDTTTSVTTQTISPITLSPVVAKTTIPADIQVIIYKYMKNAGSVTMKQIQSRLKGHPYTCAEISDFLDKINLIDSGSVNYPDSQKFTIAI